MWVCNVCGYVSTKTPDLNDLKLGTVVVLDTVWKPVGFGFKRLYQVMVTGIRLVKSGRHFASPEKSLFL